LQAGKGTTFASASLYQEGQLKVRATAAYTDLHQLRGEEWCGAEPPVAPRFAETRAMERGFLEIHDRIDIRITTGQELFETGNKSGKGEFVAWLRHQDGAAIDSVDLLMFSDIMPPPPYSLFGAFGWVPTVELTVQCRRIPAPGPLLGRLVSRHLTAGIIEADGDFWDSEGELVALSRQTMKVRLPA
jgi:acyl-CoA thioesterase